ncbi:hypothetical protein GOP47_0025072 [Adiantum capillus-veneris]|uniref:Uncharacterized protein n=1 Tax=Adiantum capillus-veneris TaxID=13818 RepID=A0A9D4Z4W1_ADICA|nr:hypothetical protein GOP47_0025072 [Adiantum capillus-veneris]
MATKESKRGNKAKVIFGVPHPLPTLSDASIRTWAEKLGCQTLLALPWEELAAPSQAEQLVQQFLDTNTIVVPGKQPVEVNAQLVHQVLHLPVEGAFETKQKFNPNEEVPKTGTMHQTKDVQDPARRMYLQFLLQNLLFMAKPEDMSMKNYSLIRAAEEGEKINWAQLYVDSLVVRATLSMKQGGHTVVHAHLRALAQSAPDDQPEKRVHVCSSSSSDLDLGRYVVKRSAAKKSRISVHESKPNSKHEPKPAVGQSNEMHPKKPLASVPDPQMSPVLLQLPFLKSPTMAEMIQHMETIAEACQMQACNLENWGASQEEHLQNMMQDLQEEVKGLRGMVITQKNSIQHLTGNITIVAEQNANLKAQLAQLGVELAKIREVNDMLAKDLQSKNDLLNVATTTLQQMVMEKEQRQQEEQLNEVALEQLKQECVSLAMDKDIYKLENQYLKEASGEDQEVVILPKDVKAKLIKSVTHQVESALKHASALKSFWDSGVLGPGKQP